MKVAVVTPYYRESLEVLRQCHDSVALQTHACTHILVADGFPRPEVDTWAAQHFRLPLAHADNGNTPRAFGALSARNQGFDAIAFLDADNWFHPDHIETMVRMQAETGAAVVTAARNLHRMDGSFLAADLSDSDGSRHVDTSCLFLTRPLFEVLPVWALMPRELAPICDLVFWQALLARRPQRVHCTRPTVAFRTQYQVHYLHQGETPPAGSKTNDETTVRSIAWWEAQTREDRERWLTIFGMQQAPGN
jgi:glycosyltransferase involved in cell wall biosynthesis